MLLRIHRLKPVAIEFFWRIGFGKQVYDKKFIFVPDIIVPDHLIDIDVLGLDGVLHE